MRKFTKMIAAAVLSASASFLPIASHASPGQGTGTLMQELRVFNLEGRLLIVDDRDVLSLIGRHEATDNYDIVTHYTRIRPEKPLTQMSIREVMAFQRRVVSAGAGSSAMGMYQYIRKTLEDVAIQSGLGYDAPFDRYNQDRLARYSLSECGFYRHDVPDTQIGNCLAGVWAALPLVSGPKAGQSRYQNYNGNKALTSVDALMTTIRGRFRDATPQRLAEITARGQGSVTVQGMPAPAYPQVAGYGQVPQMGFMPSPQGMAFAAAQARSVYSSAAGQPGHVGGMITGPAPQPSVSNQELERHRRLQRILYGENSGIASEKLAAH